MRAFVIENEIKVMTQYSPYYYFPDFANEARKDRLQALILKYFEVRFPVDWQVLTRRSASSQKCSR